MFSAKHLHTPMFRAKHLKVGKIGEQVAEKYLKQKGYIVITKNYRQPWGEIDIVAMDSKKTLVFFEVKTISGNVAELLPEDNLTRAKLEKLKKICLFFANRNPGLVNEASGWRIDLLALSPKNRPLLTNKENYFEIKHYQNIASS